MAKKVKKLTPNIIKNIIMEEANKLQNETLELQVDHPSKIKAKLIKADGYAQSLEKKIDHLKAIKLEEVKLLKKLKKLREAREKLSKMLVDNI
jgi:hypothetical protein